MTPIAVWTDDSLPPAIERVAEAWSHAILGTGDAAVWVLTIRAVDALPPHLWRAVLQCILGHPHDERDLAHAVAALELSDGREPPAIVELRIARDTVESHARSRWGAGGAGDREAYDAHRRRAALVLAAFERMPAHHRKPLREHLAGCSVNVESLLAAVDKLADALAKIDMT